MVTFLLVLLGFLFAVMSAFMIILILFQPGKSGSGLSGLGGGSASSALTETLGATHGEKTLVRWTSWLAGGFFVVAVALTLLANMKTAAPSTVLGDLPAEGAPAVVDIPTADSVSQETVNEAMTTEIEVAPGNTQTINVEVPAQPEPATE